MTAKKSTVPRQGPRRPHTKNASDGSGKQPAGLNLLDDDDLTAELRRLIQSIIRLVAPGRYRLSDLLGDAWEPIGPKASVGIWFKRSVDTGQFSAIESCGKTDRNHQIYDVHR